MTAPQEQCEDVHWVCVEGHHVVGSLSDMLTMGSCPTITDIGDDGTKERCGRHLHGPFVDWEDYQEVLTAAKVALVPCMLHAFDSCNPGMEHACFTCEGLYAVGKARGEPWQRIAGRTNV